MTQARLLIDLQDLEDDYPYDLKAGTIGELSDTEADGWDYLFTVNGQQCLVNDNEVEWIEEQQP